MIDDASSGQMVFYRFYSPAQRRNDPTKENTGLFYFRGNPRAPFAIIASGGGFAYVGSIHEGFPYAMEISKRGYNAFVVRYRTGLGERAATEDLAAAVSYLFRNAAELGIETAGYSVWGSSAGARMVANVGSYGVRRFGGDDLPKPAVVVMAYTAHSEYTTADDRSEEEIHPAGRRLNSHAHRGRLAAPLARNRIDAALCSLAHVCSWTCVCSITMVMYDSWLSLIQKSQRKDRFPCQRRCGASSVSVLARYSSGTSRGSWSSFVVPGATRQRKFIGRYFRNGHLRRGPWKR